MLRILSTPIPLPVLALLGILGGAMGGWSLFFASPTHTFLVNLFPDSSLPPLSPTKKVILFILAWILIAFNGNVMIYYTPLYGYCLILFFGVLVSYLSAWFNRGSRPSLSQIITLQNLFLVIQCLAVFLALVNSLPHALMTNEAIWWYLTPQHFFLSHSEVLLVISANLFFLFLEELWVGRSWKYVWNAYRAKVAFFPFNNFVESIRINFYWLILLLYVIFGRSLSMITFFYLFNGFIIFSFITTIMTTGAFIVNDIFVLVTMIFLVWRFILLMIGSLHLRPALAYEVFRVSGQGVYHEVFENNFFSSCYSTNKVSSLSTSLTSNTEWPPNE